MSRAMLDGLIQELSFEVGITKSHYEKLPDDKFDFKPHDKSSSLGSLASHIIETLSWVKSIIEDEVLDFNPETYKPEVANNQGELIAMADKLLADAVEVMSSASDDILSQNWKMSMGGQVVMEMPRIAVFRMFVLNHMIHHRGQLTVYMRMNDIFVPKTYGPTADDQTM